MTYREAIREAIREAVRADERVFLMGEDVGPYGGAFGVSLGLVEEFGPERIRDTPLSESTFVGAGIGAALGGMRPIVEVMTVNFCLLALDQIMNNAATLLHMSGGQFNVPIVIRMTTGAGRQLAAQHSHSLEGWLAHIPGLRILDSGHRRRRPRHALARRWPIRIRYSCSSTAVSTTDRGAARPNRNSVDIDRAAIRRTGDALSIITYGGSLRPALAAADELATTGLEAEVIDLRSLRPLDDGAIMASVRRTHRAVIVDEGWRSGGLAAEVSARITEQAFYDLDAPVARVCTEEVPIPYPKHLEQAALPSVEKIVNAARELMPS